MSTRARVGVQLATGEIKSVYVWRDGNPDTLGTTLNEYYATPEKAAALVEHGNLIDVEQTLRRCTFERPEEGYDNSPPQDVRRLPAGAGVRHPLQVHLPRRSMELLGDRRIADLLLF